MNKKLLLIIFSLNLFLIANAQNFYSLQINARKIVYDSKRDLIYATVDSLDSVYPNSLIAIEPTTGNVIKHLSIGSSPNDIVITSSSNYAYISFDGIPFVKRINLTVFSIDQEINLVKDNRGNPNFCNSIAVIQNNDSVCIVSLHVKAYSPGFQKVIAYSNEKKLPKVPDSKYTIDVLISTDNDIIYGYSTSYTVTQFFKLRFSADSGITLLNSQPYFFELNYPKYEKGLLFDNNGLVIDPSIPSQKGVIHLEDLGGFESYAVEPDKAKNKIFFCHVGYNQHDIDYYSFDRSTYGLISNYSIKNLFPNQYTKLQLTQLLRFGINGLVTTVYDDYIKTNQKSKIVILNNSSFTDSIPLIDKSALLKVFLFDTVKTNKIVYDTTKYYKPVYIYDTTHITSIDTLVVFSKISNVNGINVYSEIKVYPNPASDVLNIAINNNAPISEYKIQIFNSLGQMKYMSSIKSNYQKIDISQFSKGSYIVQIMDQNLKIVSKNCFIIY